MKYIDALASFAKCGALLQTKGKYIVCIYISLIMPSREKKGNMFTRIIYAIIVTCTYCLVVYYIILIIFKRFR